MAPVVTAVAGLLAAVVAAFLAHRYASYRDRVNRRNELRTTYLVEAYRSIERASNRSLEGDVETARGLEQAVADIQLFGNSDQVRLAREFSYEFAAGAGSTADQLLGSIRTELRKEFLLQREDPPAPTYLRLDSARVAPVQSTSLGSAQVQGAHRQLLTRE